MEQTRHTPVPGPVRTSTLLLLTFLALFSLVFEKALAFQDQGDGFLSYKGEVVDASSGKALVFAALNLEGTNISTITNMEGNFLIKVPREMGDRNLLVSYLGYRTRSLPLSALQGENNKIELTVSVTELAEININAPKDAQALIREVMAKKGERYLGSPTVMTAFYRETIKKRRRNVSLSEAVVTIYKTPYDSPREDAMELYKARKSTDYNKLDTVALKLQGGPYNTLFVDVMKYSQYIFTEKDLSNYRFTFDRSTMINDRPIYVIRFTQHESVADPLYQGELFIDVGNKTLTTAIFSLNITDREKAANLFVRRKPAKVDVWPTEVAYRVDYRVKDGKWYYGYSSVNMAFKVDWADKWFNSVYSMSAEMAVTDWEINPSGDLPRNRARIKKSIILNDEAIGFSDPGFWGDYNIIEPEKSIESAIRKIQRQLRRDQRNGD